MSESVIKVENLGKRYRIGEQEAYKTFREALVKVSKVPFQQFRKAFSKEQRSKNVDISSLSALNSNPAEGSSPLSSFSSPLSHSGGYIWALKNVSFEVKQGEVVGILGRNGAGKSTLLKILSKITEPTEGRVELKGRVGSLLEVGTGFHNELTGHENIYLYGAILGMDRWEVTRKFDEIVAFAEIEKFIDTPVKHYSSGMYMRLAFAVAAHLEPDILLVDEVLAVGDAAFQKKCLGKMGDASRQGRTVLFVSHNLNAIEQLCTLAIMLDKGKVIKIDYNIQKLIREYLFEGQSSIESSEWVNSGSEFQNPWFKPLRLFIADARGNKCEMPINNNTEAWFQVEAEIQENDNALTIGYAIYSENGNLLYWSYQTDNAEHKWPQLHRGLCVLRGRLPRRFFNEGLYRIELIGGLHFREWLFQPSTNVPSIFLIIKGTLSDSPFWIEKRPGLLAPIIEWDLIE
jgi:lipopolysaccharide transport system ATP-binding protein